MEDEITIFDSGNLNTFVTSVGEYLFGGGGGRVSKKRDSTVKNKIIV